MAKRNYNNSEYLFREKMIDCGETKLSLEL